MNNEQIWYEQYREEKEDKIDQILRKKRPRNTAIFDREGPADRLYGRKKIRVVKKGSQRD